MKRGIDIIRALLDGDERDQIDRYWALAALNGEECPDQPYARRETWLQWRLEGHPEWIAAGEHFRREARELHCAIIEATKS